MPIANIVDNRKRRYRSFPIHAVIEPSCNDNDSPDADQFDPNDPNITTNCEEMPDTSIYLAINWANRFSFPVTLYLYYGELDDEQRAGLEQASSELRDAIAHQMTGVVHHKD